jgi:uncharacterized protein (DUF2249 family)
MDRHGSALTIDVRKIAPQDRYRLLLPALARVAAGQAVELLHDEDLEPLLLQLKAADPGQLRWEYLPTNAQTWRVRLAGSGKPHGNGACCGACGGA